MESRDPLARARLGSTAGWPLVLYFHHVHRRFQHYTSLTPDDFARGLDLVLRCVGPALDPREVAGIRSRRPTSPSVLITLDDGYRDNVEHALPVLARFGVKAMFFVVAGRIGVPSDAGDDAPDGYMTWSDLGALHDSGHVIGGHTMTHRALHELPAAECQREVDESLAEVERRLGVRGAPFAYPYGFVPSRLDLPATTLAFGTVKSRPRPWDEAPHEIRRTFLPTDRPDLWGPLAHEWRRQWYTASR